MASVSVSDRVASVIDSSVLIQAVSGRGCNLRGAPPAHFP
jgi:hypothetical protein